MVLFFFVSSGTLLATEKAEKYPVMPALPRSDSSFYIKGGADTFSLFIPKQLFDGSRRFHQKKDSAGRNFL